MAEYNLSPRQKEIVRALVEVYNQGYDQDFMHKSLATSGQTGIRFIGREEEIIATRVDLVSLAEEGFVTLLDTQTGWKGTLKGKAYAAVETDFKLPDPSPAMGSVVIGNFINTMTGGAAQGGAGLQISMSQSVSIDMDVLQQRFDELTDQPVSLSYLQVGSASAR